MRYFSQRVTKTNHPEEAPIPVHVTGLERAAKATVGLKRRFVGVAGWTVKGTALKQIAGLIH